MHNTQLLPLADFIDLVRSIAPIIFVVLYGVAHLVGNMQKEKRKVQPPPRPAPPPELGAGAGGPAAAGGKQPNMEETLRREVEEFLRRAQGQPQQAKSQPPRPQQRPQTQPQRPAAQRPASPAAQGTVRQTERSAEQGPRRLVDSPRPESAAFSETQRPTAAPPPPTGAGVAQYVAEQMRSVQEVSEQAQQLGADVAQADERMQEHLRQRFVHQLGALTPTATVAANPRPAIPTTAQELRMLLSRPNGAKQLIIASEILRRPEERWE